MAVRDGGTASLAAPRATTQASHLRRGAGFVDKHQPGGIEIRLTLVPGPTPLRDVRPIRLGGGRGFFEADAPTIEEPPQGPDPDRKTTLPQQRLQLGQRDVSRLLDTRYQEVGLSLNPVRALVPALRQGCRTSAPMPRIDPPDRARHADTEPIRRLPPRRSLLNSLDDPNPKVLGKWRSHARWPPPPADIFNHTSSSKGIPRDSYCSENALAPSPSAPLLIVMAGHDALY